MTSTFNYSDERFADIQMLRYRLNGFEQLTLQQKRLIYYLAKATLYGRDITFDQFGKFNLRIRKTLEVICSDLRVPRENSDFQALQVYLKRVWFSNGIYHHYGCEKFKPEFSEDFLKKCLKIVDATRLPLKEGQSIEDLYNEIAPVIFNPEILSKRVNKTDGVDLVATSACNFYQNVTQQEAEEFYAAMKEVDGHESPSYGLNTTLVKEDGVIKEKVWCSEGHYANAIRHIVYWLKKASGVAENERQKEVIEILIKYYQTGGLSLFDEYSIKWLQTTDTKIDFINGFIEVYGDPLGLKGSWEGLVEYIDENATSRTRTISDNAQWFEDHSPVDPRFKKKTVKGVIANVICAAMLGGDEYPSTAIGINLPNADWIRARYGSKSITISNITEAYNKAAHGNGFREEFIKDPKILDLIEKYGDACDDLHTDLHECLGHGSGQLLPGTDPDALKAYGNTIEEARADLFGLYYIADNKLVELGLLPDNEAYKAHYFTYMLNGLMTQLVRIQPGHQIEEAHMRNRALIARWCLAHAKHMRLTHEKGVYELEIEDYNELRALIAQLLAEIQRIKSEGDFEAARQLVEDYAVQIDADLHTEVLERYKKLNLAPYKGFINPWLLPILDENGEITDIQVNYSESYDHQMMRYSTEYATLV
ncbi:dipeptidyl peptidase 3 [Prevotella sp. E2-28]|uniref:dipeptidyl peptidase 3 n=1 Tax=Prevotella sp. E2-28 TaxID=2913620 RepID=UPI001EDB4716|nr:dipeptidyl peptidase 3 [Prevotella sp. E2-28]UKK52471.1 dipeptidyl peptidase 3 [Prevotella sp. E2-28]